MKPSTEYTARLAARDLLAPNPKLRLREQVREVMRFKRRSYRMEKAFVGWRRFLVFRRDHPHLTPARSPPSEGAEREAAPRPGSYVDRFNTPGARFSLVSLVSLVWR